MRREMLGHLVVFHLDGLEPGFDPQLFLFSAGA
ncbi:hypothetical protein SBA4_20040 [Candidatus Sulfopaludibacter sp. SbA4]|nr:hypothetical protein SBA4_20040 [Candidatus Sulfopaludibacter sp. SbA4]